MSKISSKLTKPHLIFSVYVPAIAGIVMVLGMIYQILAPTPPQIISDQSIIEENRKLLVEKKLLKSEKDKLEEKLKKLEEQISAIKKVSQIDEKQLSPDYWFVTALKTFVVYISLVFSAVLTFFTFLVDLVAFPFGYSFCLTKGLWGFVWNKVTIGWYWEQARWYGVLLGILLIIGISMSSKNIDKKKHG